MRVLFEGPALLVFLTAAYFGLLLLVAHLGDRTRLGTRISRSPLVTALSLGVYATSWSYYGSVGFAAREGWRFIAIYVGVTLACALVPVVWGPLSRLARERQLTTLADVFAYRYRSQAAGVLVTLFLLAGNLPYQALQLQAVVRSMGILSRPGSASGIALVTCFLLVVLGIMFGARHLTPRERHDGLVLAIALESVVKLFALLVLAGFAVYGVFGGFGGLDEWLAEHPDVLARMAAGAREGPWTTLLIISMAAAFLLPRQWHMAFTEGLGPGGLRTTSWALPIYLLLLTIALPPILFAGMRLGLPGVTDGYVLALATSSGSTALAAFVFLGGLSAASAMILVTTIALAGMCLNHLVLPLIGFQPGEHFYRRLLWMRRGLIALVVMVGYGFYELIGNVSDGLADIGLVSFVAVAQFLPGLVGVLFWPKATRGGFLAGLSTGIVVWGLTLLVPLLVRAGLLSPGLDVLTALGLEGDPWSLSTALSLGCNGLVFALVSGSTTQRAVEAEAAATCRSDAWTPAAEGMVAISPDEFARRLAPILGAAAAEAEVRRALDDLGLGSAERRPAELWRLRERIEKNLSGLVGPVLAKAAVDETLSGDPSLRIVMSEQLRFLEAEFAARLEGPARELEHARRYLRRILEDLPLGVCTLGSADEIVLWNSALASLTGIAAAEAVGRPVEALPSPWGPLLSEFATGSEARVERQLGEPPAVRRVALGKSQVDPAALPGAPPDSSAGLVLLVEDRTEQHAMASRLAHQDRLASVGRLAAGVAHEIGNPLTGIASVAQNLASESTDADAQGRLRLIVESTRRIARILRALVTFSHAGRPLAQAERPPVSLREILREAITLASLSRAAKSVDMLLEVPEDFSVRGDKLELEQVFVNLLNNAADASPPGATVVVRAEETSGGMLAIDVVDAGCGIAPAVQGRVFEPFFTTKEPGEGTGLGLSMSYSIVVAHGGAIELESAPGRGTRVRTLLPGAQARP